MQRTKLSKVVLFLVAVTLLLPIFKLESEQRNAIRCSPGLSNFTLTLNIS
jgi:hypothetical protein